MKKQALSDSRLSLSLSCLKGFSLIELIIVVAIIGVLSGVAYVGIQREKMGTMNDKVLDDLIAVSNALEQYKRDHFGVYPIPEPGGNMNVLCYHADASYAHDCDKAVFRQGMIDNNLLTKRYLQEVPTDPRTGSRYVYGVSADGKYFMVAGIVEESAGNFEARTAENLAKGFYLPSLIRAYDGPNFVINKSPNLPYSPEHLVISATLQNVSGNVEVNGETVSAGMTLYKGATIATGAGSGADLYFSDGTVTRLDADTVFEISGESAVPENDKDNIITIIRTKLFSGKIWNKVARLASASQFEVETTTAIAGVRGTEFGVEYDEGTNDGKVMVKTGAVEVAPTASGSGSTITVEPGEASEGEAVDISGGAVDASARDLTATEKTTIEDHYYRTGIPNEGTVPYIVSVTVRPSDDYDVYVSFNGTRTENIFDIDGFELFSKAQTDGYRKMRAGALESPVHTVTAVDYSEPKHAYHFTLDYTSGGPLWKAGAERPESIIVRAFKEQNGNRLYSALSWPPIGFLKNPSEEEEYAYTDTERFPELAMKSLITGPTRATVADPVVLNALIQNQKADDISYFWNVREVPLGVDTTAFLSPLGVPTDLKSAPQVRFTPTALGKYAIALSAQSGDEVSDESVFSVIAEEGEPGECTGTPVIALGIANGSQNIPLSPSLSWTVTPSCAFAGAEFSVDLMDSSDNRVSGFPLKTNTLSSNMPAGTTLSHSSTYSWTVTANKDESIVAYQTGSFTTEEAPLDCQDGVERNGFCWYVAASATESCDDVCGQRNLACSTDADWTVDGGLCGELGFTFHSSLFGSNYSPIIAGTLCKNDNDNQRQCSLSASGPYKRICKCQP